MTGASEFWAIAADHVDSVLVIVVGATWTVATYVAQQKSYASAVKEIKKGIEHLQDDIKESIQGMESKFVSEHKLGNILQASLLKWSESFITRDLAQARLDGVDKRVDSIAESVRRIDGELVASMKRRK